MTVCIGALAAKSKAIVMVADKAITYTSYSSALLQWDVTGLCKILPIGASSWHVLMGGDPIFALQVIHACETSLLDNPGEAGNVWSMMDCVAAGDASAREKRVEEAVLRPRLLDKDALVRRDAALAPLDQRLADSVADAVGQFQIDCDLLVCGFDDQREPHLFLVGEPGLSNPYDLQGFHAIGIGTDIALGRLLWLEVDQNDPLEEVLYDAFDAKASAEIISGVGYEWDAKVLVADQPIVSVPDRIKDVIDKLLSFGHEDHGRTFDNDEVPPK